MEPHIYCEHAPASLPLRIYAIVVGAVVVGVVVWVMRTQFGVLALAERGIFLENVGAIILWRLFLHCISLAGCQIGWAEPFPLRPIWLGNCSMKNDEWSVMSGQRKVEPEPPICYKMSIDDHPRPPASTCPRAAPAGAGDAMLGGNGLSGCAA